MNYALNVKMEFNLYFKIMKNNINQNKCEKDSIDQMKFCLFLLFKIHHFN